MESKFRSQSILRMLIKYLFYATPLSLDTHFQIKLPSPLTIDWVLLKILLPNSFLKFFHQLFTVVSQTKLISHFFILFWNFSKKQYYLFHVCFFQFQEHFLIPDHKVTDINGASFAGFYYICFQKSTSTIEGYYYHRNSEW